MHHLSFIHSFDLLIFDLTDLLNTSQPGPALHGKNLEFWSLGYPGVRGSGWRGFACAKNHPWVGGEVCAKFGGDWLGGSLVKEGHRYKQSLLYM